MMDELPRNIEYLISAYSLGGFIIISYLIATYIKLKSVDLKLGKIGNRQKAEDT